jgi:hypothetical protein
MVAREPGEFGGEYYRLMPEGTLQHWDGCRSSVNRDREGLDLNRNFPAYWRQEHEQLGAGPYPTSEPEVRAMVDFIVTHPNIGAAVSFHTHSGVILRPMGTQQRRRHDARGPVDLSSGFRAGRQAHRLPGHQHLWHDFKYHPKEIITGTQDWVYEHLGALFWTVELWAPNKEAGITGYKWIDWYRDHPVEDDLKLLKWSDEQCGGQAHVDWRPFRHPQLARWRSAAGTDELLAQPAAAPARARGGALPGLADADRAVAAQAGAAAHRGARAGRPTPGACASRWPTAATCRPT